MTVETKLFEVRDRATFAPVVAVRTRSDNPIESFLLLRSGFPQDTASPQVLMTSFGRCESQWSEFDWNDRTFRCAHMYIRENWDNLTTGDIVDVEFILGETAAPKVSERILYP